MPIRDIQERFRELGRIRMGTLERPAGGGKARPRKLAKFRLTTKWRHLLDECAAAYGGEVKAWEHPNDGAQWELFVESEALDVVIPPGEVLSEWYELWTGGGCQRRCDGIRQVLTDRDCQCPASIAERQEEAGKGTACRPTTRLAVMLPAISDLGVWRLESHGYNAAFELGGAAALCELATRQGVLIPGRLALEARSVKRPDGKGGVLTRRFAVPVLGFRGNLGETLNALGFTRPDGLPVVPGSAGALAPGARPALDTGGVPELPAPAPSTAPAPSVDAAFGSSSAPVEPAAHPPMAAAPDPEPYVPPERETDPAGDEATLSWAQHFAMRCRDVPAVGNDVLRHGLLVALTGGRTQSGKDLTPTEKSQAMAAIVLLARGKATLASPTPGFWVFESTSEGISTSGTLAGTEAPSPAAEEAPDVVIDVEGTERPADVPATQTATEPASAVPATAEDWRRFLAEHRLKIGDAVKTAAQLRPDAKANELPGNLDGLIGDPELNAAVYERLSS